MKNKKKSGICVGIVAVLGVAASAVLLLAAWLRGEAYIYDYAVSRSLGVLMNALTFLLIGLAVLCAILTVVFLLKKWGRSAWLPVFLCAVFCVCLFSAYSILGSRGDGHTLLDTVVLSRNEGDRTVTVQGENRDTPVVLKCTQAEWALLTEGTACASMQYTGDYDGGVLTYLALCP